MPVSYTHLVFEVVGVHHNTMEEKKILEYAALAESFSSHPISRSLKTAYGKEIDQTRVTDVEELSGNGVTAVSYTHLIPGKNVWLCDWQVFT